MEFGYDIYYDAANRYDFIEYKNGYRIERWNKKTYSLTRTTGVNANPIIFIDEKPVFDSMLYVNDVTRSMCKSFYNKLKVLDKQSGGKL